MWRSRMFWQLYGTYCLLVLITLGLLGIIVVQRFEDLNRIQVQESLRSNALLIERMID